MDVLSTKQRLFVEAFVGDPVEAMQVAGYEGTPQQLEKRGKELLATPLVRKAIQEKALYLQKTNTAIAKTEEIKTFWTNIMRNKDPDHIPERDEHGIIKPRENIPIAVRIKAAESLGKAEQMFVNKLEISGNLSVTDIITKAYEIDDEELDAIEAEYEEIYGKKEPDSDATPTLPSPDNEAADSSDGLSGVDDFI